MTADCWKEDALSVASRLVVPAAAAGAVAARAGEERPVVADGRLLVIVGADDPRADVMKQGLHAWFHVSGPGGNPVQSVWVGAAGPAGEAVRAGAGLPTVVSFFTIGTGYEEEAAGLRACCEGLGLVHDIRGVASRGSWEENCAMKAAFVRDRWREHAGGVVWIDADARLTRRPSLLGALGVDFGVHRCGGWQFASGTVFFGPTDGAARLLDAWVSRCDEDPTRWDQESLDLAWEDTVRAGPLSTLWLPQAYTKIFDHAPEGSDGPVVVHYQASRRLKAAVSAVPARAASVPDRGLMTARRACRPRAA